MTNVENRISPATAKYTLRRMLRALEENPSPQTVDNFEERIAPRVGVCLRTLSPTAQRKTETAKASKEKFTKAIQQLSTKRNENRSVYIFPFIRK